MSLPSLKQYHKAPYAAISPTRPELSQAGKTIVITGGNSGIGYAIARGFIKSSAQRVIILGRRLGVVQSAASGLSEEAEQLRSDTVVDGRVCDISSIESTAAFWSGLSSDGLFVDVLVLNAAAPGNSAPILQTGCSGVWADFETNVRSALDFTEQFYKQARKGPDTRLFLVNVSSCASYMWSTMAPERPSYGMTKNASTLLVQQIAKDTKPDDMQVVSFHPGGVLTDLARGIGIDETSGIPFDDENLPGHFAVWAASHEAEFLHGRFVWANWDVDEIKSNEMGKQNGENSHFLKIGIEGLSESMGSPMLPHDKLVEILLRTMQTGREPQTAN